MPVVTRKSEAQAEISLGRRFLNLQTLISFAIAFAVLYFLLVKVEVDLRKTAMVLRGTSLPLYFLAFLSYYLTFPLRGWRWRILLRNAQFNDPPPVRDLAEIVFLSYFANTLAPAKLGDLYRGYLLGRNAGVSFPKTMGTVLAERFIALVVLFAMVGAISLLGFGGRLPDVISQILGMSFLLVVVGVAGLLVMKGVRGFVRRILPTRLKSFYTRLEEGIFLSFKRFPLLLALTVIIWGMEGARLFFAARSLNLALDPPTTLFIALGAALLTTLPFTPAGLGFVESAIVAMLLLAGSLGLVQGMTESLALSVALLDRLVSYWGLLFLGIVVYIFSKKTK
jgi:hypothetical protein